MLKPIDLVVGQELREVASSRGVRSFESEPRTLAEPLQLDGTINLSWGAQTRRNAHIVPQLSVKADGRWSPWFRNGIWVGPGVRRPNRMSFDDRYLGFGGMAVDTYVYDEVPPGQQVTEWRVRVDCHGPSDLFWVAVQSANKQKWTGVSAPYPMASSLFDAPVLRQYGTVRNGKIHCGPFSAHGLLAGYGLVNPGVDGVREIIRDTVDREYEGGNWAFIAALMSVHLRQLGLRAVIQNVSSVYDIEEQYFSHGLPVIASLKWRKNELKGAIPQTGGHLMVAVGSTGRHVLAMDPATWPHRTGPVYREYLRSEWESALISGSNGTIIGVRDLPM